MRRRLLGFAGMCGLAAGLSIAGPLASAQTADGGLPPSGTVPVTGTVAADGGLPPSGTVPTDGRDAERLPDGGVASGTVPWTGAAAPALPSFLDTTDRRLVDERPPPSAEQIAALREMEAEIGRFTQSGSAYRDTVVSLVRREYLRQRRGRDQWYARQIRVEEGLMNEARDRAILIFERFIANYPDDPQYTPDAMFRLGELYFERSMNQFQDQYDAAQAARDSGQEVPESSDIPDLGATIDLYRRLVRSFPEYARLDGVYYLIGYCLHEMGELEEARLAWLNLVCANQFHYDPDAAANRAVAAAAAVAAETDGGVDADGGVAHPALALDGFDAGIAPPEVYSDPYPTCQPIREDARFLSETWFRIGEFHFDDYTDAHALDLAISAYNRILAHPDDRNYNLALYKVAWAYYRASRYPEAIQAFGNLVQWSDDEQARTGSAGSELRPEAIQYLGIAFSYDDWNENQIPDAQERLPTGIQRVQDPNLLPQDRAWTADVYFELGQDYFDEAKYPEAIQIWQLALSRWPNHQRAPDIRSQIGEARRRHDEMDNELFGDLADYGPGSPWYNANNDHPTEQRAAERMAERALMQAAMLHHQNAQRERRHCVEDRDPERCRVAQEEYAAAAAAYRAYLSHYPNDPQSYDLQYNLADALYWSDDFEGAASVYASVRDSNLDDSHMSEAARRVVESIKRRVEAAEQAGSLTIRTAPPEVSGDPPTVRPVAMPDLVQRFAQARELYIARVPEAQDSEHVRAAYDYNNALLLYSYGYWPQAKERFERIFDERCSGPNANETGQVAWVNLRQMAIATNDDAEIRRLATELESRHCTFTASEAGAAAPAVDCSDEANSENPFCLMQGDLNALQYRDALAIYHQAEGATGDEQVRLYEQAATLLVEAVNRNRNDPQAPLALEQAATALERTNRFSSAGQLYQRIIDEVGPQHPSDPERQAQLDAILANAYFRLAYNANRFFDFDRALENYRTLADSQRFGRSTDPAIIDKREGALVNSAKLLERLGRYRDATTYYQRVITSVRDPADQRVAAYRIAEMAYEQHSWSATIRAMGEFISRYQRDREAGELVVQAYWRIAQARKEMGQTREYQAALADVVSGFSRSGQEPGSYAAEYAANAKFLIVDAGMADFENFAINPGHPATMQVYVQALVSQIQDGARQAKTLADSYGPLSAYRRPTWTIASLVRQGRVWEILARAVLNAPFVMPADMQRQFRTVPADAREDIRIQVQDRVQQVLDEQVRPLECRAVAAYALAARAARAGALDDEFTQVAIDRLQAYGEERIAECIAQAQSEQAGFGAYQPAEFSRAPRGQVMEIPPDVAPPPLATEAP